MGGRLISLLIALCLGLTMSCGMKSVENQYKNMSDFQPDAIPNKVYIDDQINALNTYGQLPPDRKIFAEIRTKEGVQEKGKLVQITENDLILSTGFQYVSSNDTTLTVDRKVTISKDDILILKIW